MDKTQNFLIHISVLIQIIVYLCWFRFFLEIQLIYDIVLVLGVQHDMCIHYKMISTIS